MLKSGTCKFLIGPSRIEYIVHRTAFTNLSPMTGAMMSSTEATEACVLDGAEEGIFASLCEFAYTGDYFIPEHQVDTSPEEEHHPNLARDGLQAVRIHGENAKSTCFDDQNMSAHDYCGDSPTECSFCARENCQTGPCRKYVGFQHVVCEYLHENYYDLKASEFEAYGTYIPTIKENEDTTEVLLQHTKLYMLGDRFKIDALKTISLDRIHRTLAKFPMIWRRIPDLVPMIQLIYCNTTKGHILRSVVSRLTTVFAEQLVLHPEFKKFLQEQAGLAYDVLQCNVESAWVVEEWLNQHVRSPR
ncbi:uncharacterized protein PG986_008943 [Apiospora aurea]|uniref:BTB domain-containing protein n=1 Tax=Apiospora aurea TaxID=335848 RepID=A0ABR1Q6Y3_9PEZI